MKKQVVNPYLPSYEYVPDGEPHVFGDRVYIFGSHDKFNGIMYCENDYVCWSAPVDDLSAWKYEGVIYRKTQDPVAAKVPAQMYAPDVTQGPDGRFYLYYGLDFKNRIGIAVCDTPAGQYAYYGSVQYPDGTEYGKRKREVFRFDPAVLTDDDGSVYLYTGFCSPSKFLQLLGVFQWHITIDTLGSTVVKLDKDMKTIISEPKRLLPGVSNSYGTGFEGHEFYEASSIRKFEGKYYAIYSSVLSHELAYAVSDYPDRGFVYQGPLHSNGNIGYRGQSKASAYWGNNHGSIERINGEYYIFGHRQTNGTEASRQGVAEKLYRNEDGSFRMAEMTSCGLNGGPLMASGKYEAGIACVLMGRSGAVKSTLGTKKREKHPYLTQDGQDRESDPAQYIANFHDGCIAGFKYFQYEESDPVVTVSLRAHRKNTGTGKLIAATDADFSNPVGQTEISVMEETTVVAIPLHIQPGVHPLYFKYEGIGALDLLKLEFQNQ